MCLPVLGASVTSLWQGTNWGAGQGNPLCAYFAPGVGSAYVGRGVQRGNYILCVVMFLMALEINNMKVY